MIHIGPRLLLALGLAISGCTEYEFALRVRDPGPIRVTSETEMVARDPTQIRVAGEPPASASAPSAPFADRGVVLSDGYHLEYARDGEWVSSIRTVRVSERAGTVSVAFVDHPGRRDLPLVLETPSANVCDLRTRSRPNRGLGWAGVVTSIMIGAIAGGTFAAGDKGHEGPYLGATAGAFLVGGVAVLVWPAGEQTRVVSGRCP